MTRKKILLILASVVVLTVGAYIALHTAKEVPQPTETNNSTISAASLSDYIPESIGSYIEYSFSDASRLGIAPVSGGTGFATNYAPLPRLTWTDQTVEEYTNRVSIDVKYPRFDGGERVAKLNQYIADIVGEKIAYDRKALSEMVGTSPETFATSISLAVRYRVVGAVKGVVSLEMVITDYTGGGNGNHDEPVVINWDLKSNRTLPTAELFCSPNYAQILLPVVRRHLIADDVSDPSWIDTGTEDVDFKDEILLKNDGIIVVFPPYTVSSGVSGIVRTFIPSKEIEGLLCL
jgi:hypothetical protein